MPLPRWRVTRPFDLPGSPLSVYVILRPTTPRHPPLSHTVDSYKFYYPPSTSRCADTLHESSAMIDT